MEKKKYPLSVNNDNLPPNYICHRCGKPGHWIRNCPTNEDPSFEQRRKERATINKEYYIASWAGGAIHTYSRKVVKQSEKDDKSAEKKGFRQGSHDLSPPITPTELKCPICKETMKDPDGSAAGCDCTSHDEYNVHRDADSEQLKDVCKDMSKDANPMGAQIKSEPPILPPLPPPSLQTVPISSTPITNIKPVYVTRDSFQQENRFQYVDPTDPRSKTVFVGNLTWWTTDVDLRAACASCNITDIENIKFFENRGNGQSKGYCSVELSSVESAKCLLNQLRNVMIHNEHPYVAIASKTPLYYFENSLGINSDGDKPPKKDFKGMGPIGTITPLNSLPPPPLPMPRLGAMPPVPGCPLPPPMPLPPPVGITPMLPPPEMLPPPPGMMAFPPTFNPLPTTGAHINPAFLPNSMPKQPGWPDAPTIKTEPGTISETDKKAMIERNHQVCKTAILRAYENCDAKHYDQAEMTVSAALKIIKFSAVADEPKSKSFISDLVECLEYVQTKTKRKSSSRSDKHRSSSRSESVRKDKDRNDRSDRDRSSHRDSEQRRDSDRRREKRRSRTPVEDHLDGREKRRSRSHDKRRDDCDRKRKGREEDNKSGEYKDYEKYNHNEYEDYKELRRRELI